MKTEEKKRIYLKEYQAPDFSVDSVVLSFNLNQDATQVHSEIKFTKQRPTSELRLDGENLKLIAISIDGKNIDPVVDEKGLTIKNPPDAFTLNCSVEIKPQENTDLEGLYKTGKNFLTQCEAQGFRKITYYTDRPDVMTHYTVHIEADKKDFPVLLSNGDLTDKQDLGNGRHKVTWKDPHKKPSYLFALVAGQFGMIEKVFTTQSGRKVDCQVYCTPGMEDRCGFSLDSLIRSMKWDEERFGREYDLNTYMVVAADDFNAGAMENKGLNVFNSKLIYANPKTATDTDYYNIESVVAHEYFHNWTGNRVTLRDWFHLSLKEGLTVFRDQEFSMDMASRSDVRISSVQDLREDQFAEDASPNAHPIRPTSCYAVDNFFTSTIYEKGSEVIRMMQTMVGRPGFRKGMDIYFDRHDGQAVVIEDFAKAISDANNQDWEQFKRWYNQAGTPSVQVSEQYDANNKTYQLTLSQECELSMQEKKEGFDKKPFHIPMVFGLFDSKTKKEIAIEQSDVDINTEKQQLLHLKDKTYTWNFKNIESKPVLSLNRQFSAPIHIKWKQSDDDLEFLLLNDTDPFNKWEASQKLMLNSILALIENPNTDISNSAWLKALPNVLQDKNLDLALKARLLSLPASSYVVQIAGKYDASAYEAAYRKILSTMATKLEAILLDAYKSFHGKRDKEISHQAFAERSYKNSALALLAELPAHHNLVAEQFKNPAHMTDEITAFQLSLDIDSLRETAIKTFYERWKSESLVLNKWFSSIAGSWHPDTFKTVQELWSHPAFDKKNPNRNYSLLGVFGGNLEKFHSEKYSAYEWFTDRILELDPINSAVSARISGDYNFWTRLQGKQKQLLEQNLKRMLNHKLSDMTFEVIKNCLAAADN